MTRLEQAIHHLNLARTYTLGLLTDIPEKDWFRMPAPGVTHIAWQVGHLAASQYHLTLARLRGVQPADQALFPADNFVELFGRASTPLANPEKYPTPAELLSTLETITAQGMKVVSALTDEQLDQPTEVSRPHRIMTTKLSALWWCAHHEFLHAGQIGLLRRLIGAKPQW
ncbi:MAG TPA: DinB family protein [Gemmatales bacterium]|nr:DinB family protein [Gemmatales bacterium]